MASHARPLSSHDAMVPVWMWPAGGPLVAYAVYAVLASAVPLPVEAAGTTLRFVVEAAAYFWAANRPELPRGLKHMLRILGGTTIGSCFVFAVMVAQAAGALEHVAFVDTFIAAAGCLSYLLGAVALLQHPRVEATGRRRTLALLDVAIAASSLAMIQWTFVRATGARPFREQAWVLIYAFAQVFMVSGLTVVVALGRAVPSARATWLFVAALGCYVPTALFGQLAIANGVAWAEHARVFFYFGAVVVVLVAAQRIRRDPITETETPLADGWLLGLNPVAILLPVLLAAFALLTLARGDTAHALPLMATLLVVVVAVMVRLALTVQQSLQLQRDAVAAREEAARAQQDERVRLLTDLHDGLGSQLVTARIRAEHGQLASEDVAGLLHECLVDLHLVVDAMKTDADSLASAVANYRARLHARLEGGPWRVRWQVALADAPPMPPSLILQVVRILQEAMNNALKHARANVITIDATCNKDGTLVLEVLDDGVGVDDAPVSGRGLETMHRRAAQIGAVLTIGACERGAGTAVVLRVPPRGDASNLAQELT